jgi:hypothetical protein
VHPKRPKPGGYRIPELASNVGGGAHSPTKQHPLALAAGTMCLKFAGARLLCTKMPPFQHSARLGEPICVLALRTAGDTCIMFALFLFALFLFGILIAGIAAGRAR